MRRLAGLVLVLLLPLPARAQMKVGGSATYKPYDPIVLTAKDVTGKSVSYLWDVDAPAQAVEAGGTCYVWAPPGRFTVRLTAVDFDAKKIERARFTFTVEGDVPPGPTPPVPPGPGPTPKPVVGLRVLIVYETADATKLPPAQQSILYGKLMRDWLNAKCAADATTGSGKAWRIADKDQDFAGLDPAWQVMMGKGKALAMPAIVIAGADGVPAFAGPLPANVADTQALISRYTPAARRTLRKAG